MKLQKRSTTPGSDDGCHISRDGQLHKYCFTLLETVRPSRIVSKSGYRARRSALLRDVRSTSSEQIVTGPLESGPPMQRNRSRKLCGKIVPTPAVAVQLFYSTNIILRSNVTSFSSNGLTACASIPYGRHCLIWHPDCTPTGRLLLGSNCHSAGISGSKDTFGLLIGTLTCTGSGSEASTTRNASLIRRLQYHHFSSVCDSGNCIALCISEPESPD